MLNALCAGCCVASEKLLRGKWVRRCSTESILCCLIASGFANVYKQI